MAIPKIIHQTYKSEDVPWKYGRYRENLIALHPGWEYKFYDDEACRDTVSRFFPMFLPIYDRALTVQKTDIFRIVAVYAFGGFYVDMDIECLSPIDDLCEFRCVFGEESTLTEEDAERLGHRDRLRVANYMFGSEPGHPFLLHILRKMAEESRRAIVTDNDVLESTGPGLVTIVYHDCRDKFRDVVFLPNLDRTCPVTGAVSCHFGNYGRHHHEGSWRFEHLGTKPFKEKASEADVEKLLTGMDKEIAAIRIPDDIYVLNTHKGEPYDGLTIVHDRSSAIGAVVDDTRHLKNKKVLVCGTPPDFTRRISKENTNVIYTTFETTELPRFWVEAINVHYDYCLVPHYHVKNVFLNSGVKVPVEVVQQGFTRYKRTYREMPPRDVFRIGFLGVPQVRKNAFKLFQACVNLLSKIPGLRLAVHVAKIYHGILYTDPGTDRTLAVRRVDIRRPLRGRSGKMARPALLLCLSFERRRMVIHAPREPVYGNTHTSDRRPGA